MALYNPDMKITTKKGDGGETGLFDGSRVSKDSPLMQALGDVDELQAMMAMCRQISGADKVVIEKIIDDLYRLMGELACRGKCPSTIEPIAEKDTRFLEQMMEKYEKIQLTEFVRPGSSEENARLQICFTASVMIPCPQNSSPNQ